MKSYRIAPSLVFWFSDFIIHRKGGYAILLCFKSCKVLFRKRVQFMYDGELMTVKFRYFGSSVEHVLDRLPTAKAKQRDVSVYDISAEVYGDGILIWLLSQGSQVEVYAPEELRQKWLDEASRIVASCDAKEGAWRQ